MSPTPAAFRITGPGGLVEVVTTCGEATQRKAENPRSTVQMMVWADLVSIVRESRAEEAAKVRAECAAELAEAKALLAAMAAELALLRQRRP